MNVIEANGLGKLPVQSSIRVRGNPPGAGRRRRPQNLYGLADVARRRWAAERRKTCCQPIGTTFRVTELRRPSRMNRRSGPREEPVGR